MNPFRMAGAWGTVPALLYETFVASGLDPLYRRLLDELPFDLPREGLLLDLGCGEGQVTRLLAARAPGCTVLGLDLSRRMLRRALRKHDNPINTLFLGGDAQALPLRSGCADLLLSVASIKHWPRPLLGVREARRVLRPGSHAVFVEAERGCSFSDSMRFVSYWRMVVPGMRPILAAYFRRYVAGQGLKLDALVGLLEEAGFADVQGRTLSGLPLVGASGRNPDDRSDYR